MSKRNIKTDKYGTYEIFAGGISTNVVSTRLHPRFDRRRTRDIDSTRSYVNFKTRYAGARLDARTKREQEVAQDIIATVVLP